MTGKVMRVHPALVDKVELYKQFFGKKMDIDLDSSNITKMMSNLLPNEEELKKIRMEEYKKRKRTRRRLIFDL